MAFISVLSLSNKHATKLNVIILPNQKISSEELRENLNAKEVSSCG